MNQKPYIIRKINGTILGPYHSTDIKSLFEAKKITKIDEICASQGRWLFLKGNINLQNTYPEIYSIVKTQKSLEWDEDTDLTKIHNQTSPRSYFFPIFSIVFTLSVAIFWSYNNSSPENKTSNLLKKVEKIHIQKRGFSLWFDDHLSEIIKESRNPSLQKKWLPYLRKYAYQNNGFIQGLNPNILRGTPIAPAPTQCTKDHWIQRWKKKSRIWMQATKDPDATWPDWMLILTWDPHWLRTHHQTDWTYPQNYMSGCLLMAKKGLDEVLENPKFVKKFLSESNSSHRSAITWIGARLQWQTHYLTTHLPPPHQPSIKLMGPLWCLEATQRTDFEHCHSGKFIAEQDKSFHIRKMAQIARYIIRDSSNLEISIDQLNKDIEKITDYEDPINGFNYSAELRFLSLFIKSEGKNSSIRPRFESEYPSVHLYHLP
ncbi:MAG: hypothetical protein AB8C84_06270 [Oligoflexales bacterium]